MENKAKRFLRLLLAIAMVMAIVPMTFALATEINGTEAISENMVWNDGDVVNGVTISGNVTITVKGTVTVNGTIRLSPDAISNVVFEGEDNAKLIRGSAFTGQMFYAEGVSGNFQNLTFNNITLDGGAVWSGEVDKTLNRGKTNEGVKATGSVLYLVYANADLNNSALQNHDDSTGEKANAVFLRYYSTIDFNNSVVRNNNSISSYYRGGVITVRQGGTVKTNGAEVYGNSGVKGGFYGTSSTGSYGGVVEVYNSKFHNNYASNGAVFDMQCNSKIGYLLIDGCEFYENSSKQGLIYEYSYSRPVIIKDSYFHDNECAVWDCHADPVLDLSGKIVVEEDPDYSKYLFETPLVLSAPLADGSSIALSEKSVSKLAGTIITGTNGYAATEADLAKLSLPANYEFYVVDINGDGFGDVVANSDEQIEIPLTLKDRANAEASATASVYSAISCLPVNPFAHEGLVFAGWVDADDNAVAKHKFAETTTLTATWKIATPTVKLSRENATLKVTVANASNAVTYTYQWYMDNVAIEGATQSTYTMTDVNSHTYKCEVTASVEGYVSVVSSASASASVPAVAQVGETKYATLQEAIDAANDQGTATVTLLKDVEFAGISQGNKVVGLTISGNVTISGAHTITRADTYTGTLFTVNKGATLTFEMVTVDGGNNWTFLKDEYEAQVMSGQRVYNDQVRYTVYEEGAPVASSAVVSVSGEVVLDGATFQNHVGATIFSVGSGAKLIMTNAVVDHNTKAGSSVVADIASGATWIINEGTEITNNHNHGGNGTLSYMKGTTIMNGGTVCHNWALKGTNNGWNCAFYVYGNGSSFVMNNGVIEENVSSILPGVANNGSNASVEINGGKIQNNTSANNNVGTEVYAYCPTTIGEGVVIRDAVAVFNNLTNNGTIDGGMYVGGTATIDGTGTVTGNMRIAGNATITSGTYLGTFNVSGSLTITGGTFAQDVSQWCAEGYACELNDDGTWGVVKQDPLVLVVAGGQNKYFVDLNEALQYAYSCSSTGVSVHILGNLTVTEPIVIRDDDMVKNSVEMRSSDLSKNFTITATGSEFIKMESGTLYIKSLNINAENDAFYVTGGTVELRCYHTVHVTNVTSQKGNCVYIRGGTVNVYGANLTSNGEYPAIQGNGAYAGDVKIGIWQYSTNNATSKITAPNSDMAIYWPGNGKLTIDAGAITGKTALYAKSGTIIINGGTFKGTGDAKAFAHYSNGAYATGDAVVIESCKDAAYETPVVTIKGGKFVSDNADAIGVYNCNEAKPMTKFISGGLFSSAPAPEWCAEGMGPKHAEDNMWTVGTGIVTVDGVYFDDWKVAKTYIHGSSVIVLYAAVENEGSFSVGAANKTVTLDLNGHKFTTTTIGVDGHKTLHITDSGKNGSVVVTNYTALYANGYLDIASDVNFNSYIQINRHSDDQQPSTGCLLIDGVKWIGRGHYQAEDLGIIGTTGGYVTIKNNFQNITFNSGKFTLNADADFTKFAEKLKEDEKTKQGVTVYKEATMNLNGHMLTTNSIVSFSELIDDPVDKTKVETGGVKVSPNHIKLPEYEDYNPKYMPIYDSANGCFRFYKFEMVSLGYKKLNETGAAVKFGVALRFVNAEAYSLLANPNNSPYMSLNFTLALEGMGITIAYEYDPAEFNKWAIEAHAHYTTQGYKGDYALILNVGGLDKLDAEAKLHVTPTLNIQCPADEPGKFVGIFSASSEVMTAPAVPTTSTDATEATNKDEETESVDNSKNSAAGGDDDNDTKAQ